MQNPDDIIQDREPKYGPFANNGDISQSLKQVCRELPTWAQLTPAHQEALDLIMTKISRIMSGDPHYVDNWDDIAGYAKLGAIHCGREEPEPVVMTIREQCAALLAEMEFEDQTMMNIRDGFIKRITTEAK